MMMEDRLYSSHMYELRGHISHRSNDNMGQVNQKPDSLMMYLQMEVRINIFRLLLV
jgi:hypothetical protein